MLIRLNNLLELSYHTSAFLELSHHTSAFLNFSGFEVDTSLIRNLINLREKDIVEKALKKSITPRDFLTIFHANGTAEHMISLKTVRNIQYDLQK